MNLLELFSAFVEVIYLTGKSVICVIESLYRQIIPPSLKSIDGEIILVTGAVGGIGREICRELIRSGQNIELVLWDLNQQALENLRKELLENNFACERLRIHVFAVDISTRENIDKAAEEVKNTVGPISIIINNAGIAPMGNFMQLSNQEIEKTIQVNLMSNFWIIRQFLPEMAAKNHGRIVNICSMSALVPASHCFPYVASKFGVNGYTESLKVELAMLKYDGIKLSTVYPYFVHTPLTTSFQMDKPTGGIMPSSLKRFLTPEDVARTTVDGMRRQYEYIYCPSSVSFAAFVYHVVPLKIRKYFEKSNFELIMFKDPKDHKKFTDPYVV